MNRALVVLTCCGLLLLSGCAGMRQPSPPEQAWEQRRLQLQMLDHWTASGKIALRTAEQAETASLVWQQVGEATHLRLSGPMGISATTVDSDGRQLEIRRGDEYSRWQLDDPALEDQNSWQLPLLALHHWMKGIPDPQLPVESLTLDESGQLPSQIRQQGWTVDYRDFALFEQYRLPTRLRLYKGDTRARIVLLMAG